MVNGQALYTVKVRAATEETKATEAESWSFMCGITVVANGGSLVSSRGDRTTICEA
jgi:hypothetical protein